MTPHGERAETHEFTDLSMGGLFVKTMFPPKIGTSVTMELRLLGTPCMAVATVAWVRPYERGPDKPIGMGLEFREVSPMLKKALYHQINEVLAHGGVALPGTPPAPDEVAAQREANRKPERKKGISGIFRKFF